MLLYGFISISYLADTKNLKTKTGYKSSEIFLFGVKFFGENEIRFGTAIFER